MKQADTNSDERIVGLLAEFPGPEALVSAARKVRSLGYRRLDAFTPFPMHDLHEALEIPSGPLPWLVLGAGIGGASLALGAQWWTNAVDYAYLISGKPLFSLPANIPITFEVTILCAAGATAFFGMLLLNKLPRLANPLHRSQRLRKATTDGFFLYIESSDERFSEAPTSTLLSALGADAIEVCRDDRQPAVMPRAIYLVLGVLAIAATIPPLWIARARAIHSPEPPLRTFSDMDFQPKFKSQTKATFFADGRAMRPPVPGTIAHGQLELDEAYYDGIATDASETAASAVDRVANRSGNSMDSVDAPAWQEQIPLPVTDELMQHGRMQFNIVCATCHGRAGDGDGPVSVRALALEQGTWVPPTSIHADHVQEQPAGQLYHTITNGVRKMPGYGDQLSPRDRWAIVLYLRALQRSRTATADDLPADELAGLRELN